MAAGGFARAAAPPAPRRLALWAVFAVYVALRVHALGGFSPRNYGVTSSPAGAVAFAGGPASPATWRFLVVPFPARVLASVPAPALLSPVASPAWLAAGPGAPGGPRGRRLERPGAAGGRPAPRLIVAFLLPVLRANSIGGSNFAERYLYLPSVGLAWLAGSWGAGWRRSVPRPAAPEGRHRRGPGRPRRPGGRRLGARRDLPGDLTLFRAAVRTAPASEIARNNLGHGAVQPAGVSTRPSASTGRPSAWTPRPCRRWPTWRCCGSGGGTSAARETAFEEALRGSPTHAVAAVHLARMSAQAVGTGPGRSGVSTPCSPPAVRATMRWSSAPGSGSRRGGRTLPGPCWNGL